jgi:nucleoside-diphosphate-sugar epimerase
MMSDKKIIAVVGATGAQGGGLVRAILADPAGPFTARALTRDTDSDRARDLAARGAEVIEADLDDATSVRKAFDGAYGAYHRAFVSNSCHFSAPIRNQAGSPAEVSRRLRATPSRDSRN